MVIELETKADFDQALKENAKVVVDFTASWCGPCRMIKPIYEKLDTEFKEIAFFKVDVDKNDETSEAEGIQAMPTFKFYKGGVVVTDLTLEGASEAKLRENLGKL